MTTTNLSQDKENLLKIIKEKALFKEKITLSSGKESDYYIDARLITLSPEGAYLSAKIILDMIKGQDIDSIGGPTIGADPIVGAVAALSFENQTPISTFIVRKAPKAYGKQQQVEGPLLKKGAKVVLVDDVATTGKSFVQSIDILKNIDVDVVGAICIVDRDEGAKETLAGYDCKLSSIFSASDIV